VGKGALAPCPPSCLKQPYHLRGGHAEFIIGRIRATDGFAHPATLETARMNSSPERTDSTVDPKLLEILVCPLTKGPLEFDSARQELISRSAKLAYPIRDGIPIMLPEEARKIE
jgi:uncharacterized protein YbaR (Trm112 family)